VHRVHFLWPIGMGLHDVGGLNAIVHAVFLGACIKPPPPAQAHISSGTSGAPNPGATSFGGDAATPTGCQVVPADPWFVGSLPTQLGLKWAAGDCSLEEENKRLKRAIQYQAGTVAAAHASEANLRHRNRLLETNVKTAVSKREALRRRCARMLSTDHIVMGGRRMRLVAMQQDADTPAGKEKFSTVPIDAEGNDVMDEEAPADIRPRKRKVRCFDNLVTVEKGAARSRGSEGGWEYTWEAKKNQFLHDSEASGGPESSSLH
jgi:hypothetical protein